MGELGSDSLHTLKLEWDKLRDTPEVKPDYYLIRAVTILEVFTKRASRYSSITVKSTQ